jgi:hypothetical protein
MKFWERKLTWAVSENQTSELIFNTAFNLSKGELNMLFVKENEVNEFKKRLKRIIDLSNESNFETTIDNKIELPIRKIFKLGNGQVSYETNRSSFSEYSLPVKSIRTKGIKLLDISRFKNDKTLTSYTDILIKDFNKRIVNRYSWKNLNIKLENDNLKDTPVSILDNKYRLLKCIDIEKTILSFRSDPIVPMKKINNLLDLINGFLLKKFVWENSAQKENWIKNKFEIIEKRENLKLNYKIKYSFLPYQKSSTSYLKYFNKNVFDDEELNKLSNDSEKLIIDFIDYLISNRIWGEDSNTCFILSYENLPDSIKNLENNILFLERLVSKLNFSIVMLTTNFKNMNFENFFSTYTGSLIGQTINVNKNFSEGKNYSNIRERYKYFSPTLIEQAEEQSNLFLYVRNFKEMLLFKKTFNYFHEKIGNYNKIIVLPYLKKEAPTEVQNDEIFIAKDYILIDKTKVKWDFSKLKVFREKEFKLKNNLSIKYNEMSFNEIKILDQVWNIEDFNSWENINLFEIYKEIIGKFSDAKKIIFENSKDSEIPKLDLN